MFCRRKVKQINNLKYFSTMHQDNVSSQLTSQLDSVDKIKIVIIILAVLFDYPGSFHKRAHLCFVWFLCPSPRSHCVYTRQRVLVEPRPWLTHGNFHTSTSTCPGSGGPIIVRKGFKAQSEEVNAEENLRVWEMTMRVVIYLRRGLILWSESQTVSREKKIIF